ncbi:uncharacterized protein [Dysidea avara]|uniref:uncharacterized protein isoform X2 n=1 Tax=Dysidea avara TaxID=196820 RepID=UPI00331B11A6
MEDDSSDIVISDLESVSDSDSNDLWNDNDSNCSSPNASNSLLSSLTSSLNSNSNLSTVPSQNSIAACLQPQLDNSANLCNLQSSIPSENNRLPDKPDLEKDIGDELDSLVAEVNDDANKDSNLHDLADNLHYTEQKNKHKQFNRLVKEAVLKKLKRLEKEDVEKASEVALEEYIKSVEVIKTVHKKSSQEFKHNSQVGTISKSKEPIGILRESVKNQSNDVEKVKSTPGTNSSKDNTVAQALAAGLPPEEVLALIPGDITALTPAALVTLMEMMLVVFSKKKNHKITSSQAFRKAVSKYSDMRKVKKLSVLLSESQTTQADIKVEDLLAEFKSKADYRSIGVVEKPSKKVISGVDVLKYEVDDLVKDVYALSDSQTKSDPRVTAAASATLLQVFQVGINNSDSEEEVSDEVADDGSEASMSSTTASTDEHGGYQADESSSEDESVHPAVFTGAARTFYEETRENVREELAVPPKPPLLYDEAMVCASSQFPASTFFFDGHCLIEVLKTTQSSHGYELYAKLCGQFVIIVFPRDGTHTFDRKQLHTYLQSAYVGAQLCKYLAGIGIGLLRHNYQSVINFEYLPTLLQLLVLYSLDSRTNTLPEDNSLDVLTEHQRDSFNSLPVPVRSDDEGQEGHQSVTTPTHHHSSRQSAQLVAEMFPINHNSSATRHHARSQSSSFHLSSSSQRFDSGPASPNEGYESLHIYQRNPDLYQDEMCQRSPQQLGTPYQEERTVIELCQRRQDLGFPALGTASPDDFYRVTECKCEEQSTIDIGEIVVAPPLSGYAGCDPDPDFPGWDRSCDIVHYFLPPDCGAINVTLLQPNVEGNAHNLKSSSDTIPSSGDGDSNHITQSKDEEEEKLDLASSGLPIHFKGKNGTIESGSHPAIWTVLKLQLLLAASLYM